MRLALPVVVLATFLLPTPGIAGTISFVVSGGELPVDFGLAPFIMSDDLRDESFGQIGSATLVSGPLLDLDVDIDGGWTSYTFGAGVLSLTLTVDDADGNPVAGTFQARTDPFSIDVCEGCDSLFGGGLADDFEIGIGRGKFSAALANALGIGRKSGGGFIDFGLEDIDGDPDSVYRTGWDHRGYAPLEIQTTVPEPGLMAFTALSGAAFMLRRRRARR